MCHGSRPLRLRQNFRRCRSKKVGTQAAQPCQGRSAGTGALSGQINAHAIFRNRESVVEMFWNGLVSSVACQRYFGRYSGFPDLSQKYLDQISLYRVFHDVGMEYRWLRRYRLPRENTPSRPSSPSHITLELRNSASRGRKDGSIPYIRNINDTNEKSNTVYVLLPTQACY